MATEIDAKVASLLDSTLVAFNKGSRAGVKENDLIVLWRTADLTDPDTDDPLGKLKMEALRLSVVHVQDTLCVGQITSKAEVEGLTTGIVLGGWEQKKRATNNLRDADGRNLILVSRGDEATIYIELVEV
jgi:hypothetical protein